MNKDESLELQSLAAGTRCAVLAFVLILGFFNLQLCLKIAAFQRIFDEMFRGRPLSLITRFVFDTSSTLIFLSLLLPVIAVAVAIGLRNHRNALMALSGIMVFTFLKMQLVLMATYSPIIDAVRLING